MWPKGRHFELGLLALSALSRNAQGGVAREFLLSAGGVLGAQVVCVCTSAAARVCVCVFDR